MSRYLVVVMAAVISMAFMAGCDDHLALAESSFGKLGEKNSKANSANVISMGRDDEEGKAKKWHIGGRFD